MMYNVFLVTEEGVIGSFFNYPLVVAGMQALVLLGIGIYLLIYVLKFLGWW